MYEMISGRRPFQSDYEQAVIYSILNEEPKPLSSLNLNIPSELEQLVARALEKNPENRYQQMSDILDDLRQLRKMLESGKLAQPSPQKPPAPSIAVLPFIDMSAKKDHEYFCEGIAEELINALTRIENLHVVSRRASFRFAGKDIHEIGKLLNVDSLL